MLVQLKLQAIKLIDAQRLKGMLDETGLGQEAKGPASIWTQARTAKCNQL